MIFWSVILGGAALSVSGVNLLFPATSDVLMLQFWNVVHALVGVVLVAIMIAHIYIGSVGMEGAYDAMGSGEVDLNWARSTIRSGSRKSSPSRVQHRARRVFLRNNPPEPRECSARFTPGAFALR